MSDDDRGLPFPDRMPPLRIVVLIPCYNEAASISKVISDFRSALPGAIVYVYDNNSTDRTAEVATAAGAVVRREPFQGKGNVVRRMFSDIDADVYVMVDGDDTYDAARAPELIAALIDEQLDMVNAARVTHEQAAYRLGHRFGNRLLTGFVGAVFGRQFRDMLSGYRVFSRRFVKSFPSLSSGFEIETELTIHALELRMRVREIGAEYRARPSGSESKLNTVRDGVRILSKILLFIKEERPLSFFSAIGGMFALSALLLAVPIFVDYFQTGLVPRFPTAVLSTGLMLIAVLCVVCGLILDTVTTGRQEVKRLHYLAIPLIENRPPLRRAIDADAPMPAWPAASRQSTAAADLILPAATATRSREDPIV